LPHRSNAVRSMERMREAISVSLLIKGSPRVDNSVIRSHGMVRGQFQFFFRCPTENPFHHAADRLGSRSLRQGASLLYGRRASK
jgi:hypothetical protein